MKKIWTFTFIIIFNHTLFAQTFDSINYQKYHFKVNFGIGGMYFLKDSAEMNKPQNVYNFGLELSTQINQKLALGFSYSYFYSKKFNNSFTLKYVDALGGSGTYYQTDLLNQYSEHQMCILFNYLFLKKRNTSLSVQIEPGYYFLRENSFKQVYVFPPNDILIDDKLYSGLAIKLKFPCVQVVSKKIGIGLNPGISIQTAEGRNEAQGSNYYYNYFGITTYYHNTYLLNFFLELSIIF